MNTKIWDARAALSNAMKNNHPQWLIDWAGDNVLIEQSSIRIETMKRQLNQEVLDALIADLNKQIK